MPGLWRLCPIQPPDLAMVGNPLGQNAEMISCYLARRRCRHTCKKYDLHPEIAARHPSVGRCNHFLAFLEAWNRGVFERMSPSKDIGKAPGAMCSCGGAGPPCCRFESPFQRREFLHLFLVAACDQQRLALGRGLPIAARSSPCVQQRVKERSLVRVIAHPMGQ